MAAHDPRDELERFLTPPWKSDFFQTVLLVEYLERTRRAAEGLPTNTPGSGDDPELEPIRFRSHVGLGFSTRDLLDIELAPRGGGPPTLSVDFMGLAGARGPMPLWMAQLIRDRNRLGDEGMQDFLDLFNHRLISMLWRLRQKNRPTLHVGPIHTHDYALYLQALTGLRTEKARAAFNLYPDDYDPEGDDHLLLARDLVYYAGLFWQHDRSVQGLERLLGHYFGFRVRGRQCQGHWIHLEPEARTALSATRRNNALGITAIAGRKVFDVQAGFRLTIGPLDWDTFIDFLPIGRRWDALHKLTTYYTRGAFTFGFDLGVHAEVVHGRRPGLSTAPAGPRLGWTSWLTTRPMPAGTTGISVSGRIHPLGDQVTAAEEALAPADGP